MIAKQKIDATIDGLRYVVNAGEAIPPPLAAYWKAANLEAKVRTCGLIEPDATAKAAPVAAKKETA